MPDQPMHAVDELAALFNRDRRRDLQAARRACDQDGHQYQVAGRLSPTRVVCKRCRCSWAIGPKTEPTT